MVEILGNDLLQHVKLAIRTLGGTWPTEGFMEVPARQEVLPQLTVGGFLLSASNICIYSRFEAIRIR